MEYEIDVGRDLYAASKQTCGIGYSRARGSNPAAAPLGMRASGMALRHRGGAGLTKALGKDTR